MLFCSAQNEKAYVHIYTCREVNLYLPPSPSLWEIAMIPQKRSIHPTMKKKQHGSMFSFKARVTSRLYLVNNFCCIVSKYVIIYIM